MIGGATAVSGGARGYRQGQREGHQNSAESKAEPRPVQVGDWLGEDWIINGGLKPGDKVIVDGTARIFAPGSPVVVEDPAKQGEEAKKAPAKK